MTTRPPHRAALALTIVGCFAGGSLYGWSGYSPAIRSAYGINHANVSMVFSIALVSFTLGVLLGPTVTSRIASQVRLTVLCGLGALVLACASLSPGFSAFLLCYGLVFGFVSGALYSYTLAQASRSARPTLLVPVSVAAFALGGAVFGPASMWLSKAGFELWSTLPAAICLALVAISSALIEQDDFGDTSATLAPLPPMRPDRNTALLWALFACGSCPGLVILGFASQIVPDSGSFFVLAGSAMFVASIGNTTGRLGASVVAGGLGPARGVAVSLALSVVAALGLIIAGGPVALVVWLFFAAFGYGLLAANMPLFVRHVVGVKAFPATFGWAFTGWGFAGLVGPWTAGWLMDIRGDFTVALALGAAVAALGLGLVAAISAGDPIEDQVADVPASDS